MNAGAGRDTDATDELIDVRADLGDQRHNSPEIFGQVAGLHCDLAAEQARRDELLHPGAPVLCSRCVSDISTIDS
jgi:hypothetical protein